MNNNGALVISLDFELLWGVFDKVIWNEKKLYFQNTRKLIPEILSLFEKNEISCTWAIVGMLFNESWEEWNHNKPVILPEYNDQTLSPYKFGNKIQSTETEELCFAPELIKLIQNTPLQEIGTHTYSHYYCLEPGQNVNSFEMDLLKAIEMAVKFQINLSSLVFPRNQYNPEYLNKCRENGILNVRSNPDSWYWRNLGEESLQNKIFRTADAYVGPLDKSYKVSDIVKYDGIILAQKASRFLRPNSGNRFLDNMRLKRVIEEMESAAKKGEIYHLWWHPHNFGNNPEKNMEDLSILLKHYRKCKKKYNFHSLNMGEINSKITNLN